MFSNRYFRIINWICPYSSTLIFASNANVQVTGNEWNVGFDDVSSKAGTIEITAKTVQGSNSNGTLSMHKYNKKQQEKL